MDRLVNTLPSVLRRLKRNLYKRPITRRQLSESCVKSSRPSRLTVNASIVFITCKQILPYHPLCDVAFNTKFNESPFILLKIRMSKYNMTRQVVDINQLFKLLQNAKIYFCLSQYK